MTTRSRKSVQALPSHVLAKLAVVPFDRDIDDLSVFLGEEIRVGEEADGSPVTVQFGGHHELDGSGASCVLYIRTGGRDALCLTLSTADRLALEMVGQAALGRQVQEPEAVTIALDDCAEAKLFDPSNIDDAATVMNWPLDRPQAGKDVA